MQIKTISIAALMALVSSSVSGSRLGEISAATQDNHGRKLFFCGEGSWKCTKRGWWNICLRGTCGCKLGWEKDWLGRCTKNVLPCPVPTTQPDIDLQEWTRATWYVQAQQVNEYQPLDKLNCVAATYDLQKDRKVPFFSGDVVSVYNYANENRVNGKPVNGRPGATEEPGLVLCGRVPNKDEASKLLVAPCFLPNSFAGDYWILAAGENNGQYEWAVVSGGKPTERFEDGCTTKRDGINGSGLWIFSRKPVDPEGKAKALAVLRQKGYATSQLVDVPQEGCTYENAFIKA